MHESDFNPMIHRRNHARTDVDMLMNQFDGEPEEDNTSPARNGKRRRSSPPVAAPPSDDEKDDDYVYERPAQDEDTIVVGSTGTPRPSKRITKTVAARNSVASRQTRSQTLEASGQEHNA